MQWKDLGPCWEHSGEQGGEDWLKSRIGRITSSTIGYLAGHGSNFKTLQEIGLIIAGVHKETPDEEHEKFLTHGKVTEPIARKWFSDNFTQNYDIIERGLCVPKFDKYIGASVDGDILPKNTLRMQKLNPREKVEGFDDCIIEIKSPQKMYRSLQTYTENIDMGWVPPPGYSGHIIKTHYDQMQTGMKVLNKRFCTYIVYCTSSEECFTQKLQFDPVYWENLYVTAKRNYDIYVKPHVRPSQMIFP